MNGRFTIAWRLWTAIGLIAATLILQALVVGSRSLEVTQAAAAADDRADRIATLAARWASLTEANVERVVATVIAGDPALLQHFGPQIKATAGKINDVQKELEALTSSDADKAQLAKVSAARKAYIDARDAVVALRAKGEAEAAGQQLRAAVLPAVSVYLAEQRAFLDLQGRQAAEQRAGFAAARLTSIYISVAVMGIMLVCMALGGLVLVRSIVRPLREAGEVSRRIGDGDLTVHVDTGRRDEVGELLRAVASMRDSLRGVVSQVRASTDSIQVASSEVAQGNTDLSQRTETAASSLQQTASAMEELTSTVRQTADSARTASQLAASASTVAGRGGNVVAQVVSTMDDINTSSRKIADITGVIDGIAFQTNILALNAAVEAARAGEQGRGFAVVAGEVRSLAQRSAEAAREIKSLIGASVERVESGARLVADAGSTMTEIVGSVQRVTDIIAEISAAAEEQSSGIGSVNDAVAQLDQATQQNAALVEESAAAAESLREQARQLADLVTGFKVDAATGPVVAPVATRAPAAPSRLAAQVVSAARQGTPARKPPGKAAPAAVAVSASPSTTASTTASTAAIAPAAGPKAASAAATTADNGDWETF